MALLDLPLDLLVLITPHLDLPSFLALTSTCKALHSPQIREDPLFWSGRVRRDFRVPNQPVVASDGKRWMNLYRRLQTQSRIYTWGNNDRQCLGHETQQHPSAGQNSALPRRGRMMPRIQARGQHLRLTRASWPEEMVGLDDLGVISDLQSGGWSYTLLTAKGALYTVGVLNGMEYRHRSHPAPHPLSYPSRFGQPKDRYDAETATRQFSAGRAHVLAVSDSGNVWSWSNTEHTGIQVRFPLIEHKGAVKKVVAGWNKSAALIEGTGIVVWEPLDSDADDMTHTDATQNIGGRMEQQTDAALVLESEVILQTNHVDVRHTKSGNATEIRDEDRVGEVQSFIVLENSIIFNTSLGKVFASLTTWSAERRTLSEPIELPIPDKAFVTDVQGSFQNFAVFLETGAVLTSKQDTLMPYLHESDGQRLWTRIPALQNRGVIALAFGDYHFHALHAPGHITSYGYEPQSCGALGLGGGPHGSGSGLVAARLRGIDALGGDGHLVPHAYTEGRRVWFERPKRDWLSFMAEGGVDHQESKSRVLMATSRDQDGGCQGEISEWIEQEARNWSSKYGIDAGDDGLGAYFALGVTAAGWHSGALVLVNDELVEKLDKTVQLPGDPSTIKPESSSSSPFRPPPSAPAKKRHIWDGDSFPRLRLSDGREMPGEGQDFDEWAIGRPEWKFGWEAGEDE